MESTDKLRKLADECYTFNDCSDKLVVIADEIEREIAERYMLLPVDADGVPIHVGDEIQYVNEQGGTGAKVTVCAISDCYVYYPKRSIHAYPPESCRHVNPRTLEDVLEEYADKCYKLVRDGNGGLFASKTREVAAEIRELFGGDA